MSTSGIGDGAADSVDADRWTVRPDVRRTADDIASASDVDVILYNGPIVEPNDDQFIEVCRDRSKRPYALLILVTEGGSPNAAYRIATTLQESYERFQLFVPGVCKSAGTLVAVGAHELVMGEHGQLGPLDVQMGYGGSGLNVSDSLAALNQMALNAFGDFYDQLMEEYDGLQSHTAMDIATELTVGLYSPVFERVDPLYVGESNRAMMIALYYGNRLLTVGQNIDEIALNLLVWDYVSHDFVIDRAEAARLFDAVRVPSELESTLALDLGELALEETNGTLTPFEFLSTEVTD